MAERVERERILLLLVSLLALLAFVLGLTGIEAALGWLLLGTAILARAPAAEPDEAPAVEPFEPRRISDPLPDVAATLGALDAPAFVLGRDATVLFQNRAAEKAFGTLPPGSHISARLRSPGILDMVRETMATGEPNQIEHSERLPSERVFVLRIAPIELAEPPPTAGKLYLLSFRDVSELRRIDRMRSDFVANASHELRTPLASLRGFIETLQGPARADPAAQDRFLGIMLDQATRMSRLVDDLLSLSRLELKSHIAPDESVDLVPLLGHVRDSLVPLADDLGVEIRMHLPEGKVEVLGDRDELVQVFENLIENACKYGQEGKAVDVYLRNDASQPVEVSVVDQGPGIPAEHVPRLTERFYRVSVADSRSKKGTGLGLAIVKHILTRHRARLLVRSEIGRGTDFTVRF
ncbi:phosphate regulon sensor histidine kinase PhoR [Rhizobium sp. LC145]|uniref:phosphate regulon sensor histidine kinase PhoR n=1 Tax=Rhizobium sp. LC145 TaxID=1120688 RepID=UPI000629E350|nr:phosphate regulon sensor histidine kinase PhoR [Rhizobium sp. LC145]KKX31888.1 histidine kinase [Rhizobium sp. LC145]TKT56165.1 phosphate regulon sensor histidine kinase PhoR [Rhizobiaceae bacterium LC148]